MDSVAGHNNWWIGQCRVIDEAIPVSVAGQMEGSLACRQLMGSGGSVSEHWMHCNWANGKLFSWAAASIVYSAEREVPNG